MLLTQSKVIALVGPNASGKSNLGIKLAKVFNGEIISADSRQVYKGLDIGSGKVTAKERKLIPHYLLDAANPKKFFTIADFIKLANKKITEVCKKKRLPIIVGGTGFWIDGLLFGLSFPEVKPDFKLRKKLNRFSSVELFKKLKKLDPVRAKRIDPNNPVRLIRALEIVLKTKNIIPPLKSRPPYQVLWLGINPGYQQLKAKIKIRLKKRLAQGMLKEVKNLLKSGVPAKKLIDLGLEYRYLTLFLQKKISKIEMENQLYSAICQYAKRQMTWFKRNKKIHWLKNFSQAKALTKNFLLKD